MKSDENKRNPTAFEYNLKIEDIPIDAEKVGSILYRDAPTKKMKEKVAEKKFINHIKKIKDKYLHILNPVGFVREISIQDFKILFDPFFRSDSPIKRAISQWKKTALFILTIGSELESSVESCLQRGDLTDGLFLDALGSSLTEQLADEIQNKWEKDNPCKQENENSEEVKSPSYRTLRYSPGYCGWDVSCQGILFGYMADLSLPVSLTEKGMMYPRKSLSGVIVREKTHPTIPLTASCRFCPTPCPKRR